MSARMTTVAVASDASKSKRAAHSPSASCSPGSAPSPDRRPNASCPADRGGSREPTRRAAHPRLSSRGRLTRRSTGTSAWRIRQDPGGGSWWSHVTHVDGSRTLAGAGNRSLAHAEHVAVGVLEPGTPSRTDLGDEVDRLRRLIFLEGHPTRGQIADDGLEVVDLEMRHRLTDVRLPAPNPDLRSLPGTAPERERRLVEQCQAQLLLEESFRTVKVTATVGTTIESTST